MNEDSIADLLDLVASLSARVSPLAEQPDLVRTIRTSLREPGQRSAVLQLLVWLDVNVTAALVPELVEVGMSHRHAMTVRGVLGRVPRETLDTALPGVIRERLPTSEADEARRLAELLSHLGMRSALDELVQQAMLSDDADLREVGNDFKSH